MEGLVGKGDRRFRDRRRSSFNKKYRAWKEAEGAQLVIDGAIFAADEWEQEAQEHRCPIESPTDCCCCGC